MEVVGPVAIGLARSVSKFELSGAENLPFTGPAIVAVNHTTIVDVAPVIGALYRNGLRSSHACGRDGCGTTHGHIRFLATEMLFANPIFGPMVKQAGYLPVGTARSAVVALKSAIEALHRGEIIGIYPEGDVAATSDGSPRKFRIGVGRLALETGATIVPVAHHDARQIGSGSLGRSLLGALTSVVRRPTIRIRVGTPIRAAEYAGHTLAETVSLVQERVTDVWRSLAGSPASRADG